MIFGRHKYGVASGAVNPIDVWRDQQILFAILIGACKKVSWIIVYCVHIIDLLALITPNFFGAASENKM